MSDDFCLKGGLARIGGLAVVVMGTVKGHTPGDMQAANYGESGAWGGGSGRAAAGGEEKGVGWDMKSKAQVEVVQHNFTLV